MHVYTTQRLRCPACNKHAVAPAPREGRRHRSDYALRSRPRVNNYARNACGRDYAIPEHRRVLVPVLVHTNMYDL